MIQQVNLYRLYNAHTTAVSVDPIIQIGYGKSELKRGSQLVFPYSRAILSLIHQISFMDDRVLSISEIRFRVSMAMSPTQRPRGVLGFWSSLMTALGNTENMPVSLLMHFY